MVVLKEVKSMFWGVTIESGKHYTQTVERSFHISMAALEPQAANTGTPGKPSSKGVVSIMIQHDKAEFLLCSLEHGKLFQQPLDLNFTEGEEVTFFLNGSGIVHLSGYLVEDSEYQSDLDDLDDTDYLGNSDDDNDSDSEAPELVSPEDSDEDEDDDDKLLKAIAVARKRKKEQKEKPGKKKAKVMVEEDDDEDDDYDDDDDDDFEDELDDDSDEDDDDDDDELNFLDDMAEEDSDEEESDEDFTPQKPSKKNKTPQKDTKSTPKVKEEKASAKKEKSTPKPKQEKPTPEKKNEQTKNTPQKSAENEADPDKSSKKKKKKKKKKEGDEQGTGDTPQKNQQEKQTPKAVKKVLSGGLIAEDLKVGHGPDAKQGKFVHVYYTGKLAKSGKQFDSCTSGKPFKFRLGKREVIAGWDSGIQGMKVGGKRRLVVPPQQGYGNQKQGPIPANSTLIFEVEVKAVS